MSRALRKAIIKNAIGHFRNLIEHSLRPYEPTPEHVLKRLLKPLCTDLQRLSVTGTAGDAKNAIEALSQTCRELLR